MPLSDEPKVSVVLSSHARPHTLVPQILAYRRQTIEPAEIVVFHDGPQQLPAEYRSLGPKQRADKVVSLSWKSGVWPRFLSVPWLARHPWIAFADDDSIPGERWLENCWAHRNRGLLGTVGLRFDGETYAEGGKDFGWRKINNEQPEQVDILGHAWFGPRQAWENLWQIHPLALSIAREFPLCGEDMLLSACAGRIGGAWVPPHPSLERSLWGSVRGMELGADSVALYKLPGSRDDKMAAIRAIEKAIGWQRMFRVGDRSA